MNGPGFWFSAWEAAKRLSFVWSINTVAALLLLIEFYKKTAFMLPTLVLAVFAIAGSYVMRHEQLAGPQRLSRLIIIFCIALLALSCIGILKNLAQYTIADAMLLVLAAIVVELLFNLVTHIVRKVY